MAGDDASLPGARPRLEHLVEHPPRRLMLTPWDLVLTMDFTVLVVSLAVVANYWLFDSATTGYVLGPSVALIMPFAAWRARRHKTPPAPPSDDPVRRMLGVILLGIGATMVLVGAPLAVLGLAFTHDQVSKDATVVLTVPLFFIPLLLGHGVMYGGARIRAPR